MKSVPREAPPDAVLVVGYGNELRGDDAAGPRVAAAVAALGLQNVRVRILHQLTPELSEEISRARAVVFADASVGAVGAEVQVVPLEPASVPTLR